MTRLKLPGLAVTVGLLLAVTAPACAFESPRERVTRLAAEGARHEVDGARTRMIGLLREGWKSGRLSPDKTMEALEHDFGRRDGTPYSGAIFAMEPEPDGTVHADMVLTSGASAGGGLNYVQMGAAACVRLSGRPAPDPAVTVSDVTCPDGVAANNVVVVKVGKSS